MRLAIAGALDFALLVLAPNAPGQAQNLTVSLLPIPVDSAGSLGYSHNAVAKQFLHSTRLTTAQWAKDHPEPARRFAAAMHDTAIWANEKTNRPVTVAVMERARFGGMLTAASIQPAIELIYR